MKTAESKETSGEVTKKLKCVISIVKKCVCIRQNISDPTSVDRRRPINQYYMDKGVLWNYNESPQKTAEDSSRDEVICWNNF